MGAVGYGEGRDFVIEARYARRDYSKFPALADELLRAQVDLIVAGGPAFRSWRLPATNHRLAVRPWQFFLRHPAASG